MQPDPNKIQAMLEWPNPKNIKQLRGFIGLTGYYRKFIRNYAAIAIPLTNLLKKDAFTWDDATQNSFYALKKKMTEAPVLSMPDFNLPFELETDASNYAIGAVLLQQNHPIAFFSKKLSPQMCSASTYVRELFAIIEAVAKWRHYLLGRQFIIKTDHRNLKHLMDQVIQTPEQHHYLSKLLGFNYTIVYKPGRDNVVADALSRVVGEQFSDNPAPVTNQMLMSNGLYFALSTISSILLEKLRLEVL